MVDPLRWCEHECMGKVIILLTDYHKIIFILIEFLLNTVNIWLGVHAYGMSYESFIVDIGVSVETLFLVW